MLKPLLGDSFKPWLSRSYSGRRIDFRTKGSILTFALSKIGWLRRLNQFDRSD